MRQPPIVLQYVVILRVHSLGESLHYGLQTARRGPCQQVCNTRDNNRGVCSTAVDDVCSYQNLRQRLIWYIRQLRAVVLRDDKLLISHQFLMENVQGRLGRK